MNREDAHKLLGGYATGTLTPEEREALFAAALEDQDLFDALANEQPLHDLLREPAARARLLAALEERPPAWYKVWWRPGLAVVATVAMAIFAIVAVREKPEVEVAQVSRPQLKVFQAPPPAARPEQKVELPPPPKIVLPKVKPGPLPLNIPAAAPPPPSPAVQVADTSKASEARPMARIAAGALTMRAAAPAATGPLGVRFTILRKQPDGQFAAAGPDELRKGDSIQLQFEPNQSGILSVAAVDEQGKPQVLASGFVAQSRQFTTPVLPPGITKLQVSFTRQNTVVVSGYVDQSAGAAVGSLGANNIVAPAGAQNLVFPITLAYR